MGPQNVLTIGHPPSLEQALGCALSGLPRMAFELGAGAVAVLLRSGGRVETSYFWSDLGEVAPGSEISHRDAMGLEKILAHSGAILAESPFAQLLRRLISQRSQSFLVFPWRVRQQVAAVLFGFAAREPRFGQVTESAKERLDLIGLATWSVREIARLQSELRTVTGRLAGRKLVERAKGVLQVDQGFTEDGAYEYLRRLSRQRRITLAALAEEIVRERGARDSSQLSATESGIAS